MLEVRPESVFLDPNGAESIPRLLRMGVRDGGLTGNPAGDGLTTDAMTSFGAGTSAGIPST